MRITLVVMLAVLIGSFHSATGTGPSLTSKTTGYSSQTGDLESPFNLDKDVKRTLLQEPEDRCSECSTWSRLFYNETTKTWILDDSALDSRVVDIQCIVDCAYASETIMLPLNGILRPSRTITVDKSLTITGFHEILPTNDGIYPAAENKTIITCPEGPEQGIFNIRSGGVTIANLELRDCVGEESDSPVVVGKCEANAEGVQIHHVEFVNNSHSSQPVAMNAAKSSTCGKLEMTSVSFRDNRAKGSVAIVLLGSTTILRDVRIKNNTGSGRGMVTLESDQSIAIQDSNFTYNSEFGSVISSTGSELNIQGSNFILNNGTSDGGVIYLADSNITLTKTIFEDNRSGGNGGSVYAVKNSTLTVTNSTFTRNEASEGGCCYIENSNVEILRSTFHRNKASVDGGAVRVKRGGVVCEDSVFEDNKALYEGGAIYVEKARYVAMRSVNFTSKDAAFGSVVRIDKSRTNVNLKDVHFRGGVVELTGAALYIDDSNVIIEGSSFINNTAPNGGVIYALSFDITIRNTSFQNNSADIMGGAISGDNGNITFESTRFEENRSYLGGALHFYNTTLNASDIVFLNNYASEGGGLVCKSSHVTIRPRTGVEPKILSSRQVHQNLSFGIYAQNNVGTDIGGVIDSKDSNLDIEYGHFTKNQAPDGGAIQVTSNRRTTLKISNSCFEENIADVRGGGLAVRSPNGSISTELFFTSFSRCIADQGGAVFLTSVNAVIEGCKFVNNLASHGGAAFFRKNARVTEGNETESADISITVKESFFRENNASADGGALILVGEFIAEMKFISREEGSTDPSYAKRGFRVVLESVNLKGNQAYINGGGAYGNAIDLTLKNVEVRNNTAPQGGGIFVTRTTVNISNTNVVSNQAESSGGGIMMTRESSGIIAWTSFTENSVSEEGEGGGLSLSGTTIRAKNLVFKQNTADSGGGVCLVSGSKRNSIAEKPEVDSRFLCYECTFSENKASSSGGGLNIQSQDIEVLVVAQLDRCRFEDNTASVFGGGVYFVRPFNQTRCTNWTSCSHLVIMNSSFTNNKAERSGGSIMSNDRDRVLFSCSQSTDSTDSLEFINKTKAIDLRNSQNGDGFCPQWASSRSNTRDASPLVSSYVRSCNITEVREGRKNEPSSSSIQINDTVPGERLPDILLECYDEFGHLAKSDRDGFMALLRSNIDGKLTEIFAINLNEGAWNISGVRNPPNKTFNSSYSYALEISFTLHFVKPLKVLINVRECRINEQKEDEGVQCKQCDATQFNFNPMVENCKHCDDTLDCFGSYVFPRGNYWHSSPCHVPAKKCLTADACEETAQLRNKLNGAEFENIKAELETLTCNFSESARKEHQQLQCKEGYKGVLCGSCKEDYGRSLSFACTKCNGPAVGVFILVSVCLWLAAIAAITIRGSMTIDERLSVTRQQLHDIASRRHIQVQESLPEETEMVRREETIEDETMQVIPLRSKARKRALMSASRSTDASILIGYNLPTTTVTTTAETPEEINNLKLAQLAKWKLCEVFKVTINFLQAISVAAVINVEWTTYMLTMFNASGFVGGASTALLTRAIQCFPWWNGTRYAAYAGIAAGILVPTFVVLCIVVLFAFLACKSSKGIYYFVRRSVLATLAICYFSYLSITKVAVMVFYCIGVRTVEFSSDKETHYWALDTSVECNDQDHVGFMVFGGILFVMFSVGFLLISAFILVLCRKGSGSRDPQWMADILGFLYRAYKREYVYWESTVMLRKVLLSVVAVFSYHLGGHSQGLLASCILTVSLFLQAIHKPYRVEFETVNNIESLSLLISSITFNLAQFFTKDRTNEAIKVALAAFLMTLIIGFLLYLILRLLGCVIDVVRADLRAFGKLDDENANSWNIVKTWIAFKFETCATSRPGTWVAYKLEIWADSRLGTWVASRIGFSERPGDSDDDDLKDEELGSMRGKKNNLRISETST